MESPTFADRPAPVYPRFNFAAAFAQFCSGLPLADCATMFDIPIKKLESRAQYERWPTLKAEVEARMQGLRPVHADEIARQRQLIQDNREANLRAWAKLRDDALDVIDQLRATKGVGMMKRYFHNKGQVVEHVTDISMAERATLANYLQVIAQGTYAALGDRICSTGAKDESTSAPSNTPGITIILPGVIARPRGDQKQIEGSDKTVADRVIDLRE